MKKPLQLLIMVTIFILFYQLSLQGSTIMRGMCSWYGSDFHGRVTASGETYNMYDYTAAHKTLPFGTMVKVTLLSTNKSVIVRINDRGPYVEGRIIDLSMQAAKDIGLDRIGVGEIMAEILSYGENPEEDQSTIPISPRRTLSSSTHSNIDLPQESSQRTPTLAYSENYIREHSSDPGRDNTLLYEDHSSTQPCYRNDSNCFNNTVLLRNNVQNNRPIRSYRIQFGAFQVEEFARNLALKLLDQGIETDIYAVTTEQGRLYKVLFAEDYQNRNEAETISNRFQSGGYDVWIYPIQ